MATKVGRIQKFADDQTSLLVPTMKHSKIISEIKIFGTWLVKHQSESIPDGAKGTILTIMEKYNRASGYWLDIRPAVSELFSTFLQLPEGKLLSTKGKNKVLVWLNNMTNQDLIDDENEVNTEVLSKWTVESINTEKSAVT